MSLAPDITGPPGSVAAAPTPVVDEGPSAAGILAELARRPGVDTAPVERAFELARRCHAGQIRKSGEPYLMHPLRVAETITRIGLDVNSVIAGLLHDAVEDSDLSIFDLTEGFGSEVASLVDGVTKLSALEAQTKEEAQVGTYRKMFIAMADDPRVVLVAHDNVYKRMSTEQFNALFKSKTPPSPKAAARAKQPFAARLMPPWSSPVSAAPPPCRPPKTLTTSSPPIPIPESASCISPPTTTGTNPSSMRVTRWCRSTISTSSN